TVYLLAEESAQQPLLDELPIVGRGVPPLAQEPYPRHRPPAAAFACQAIVGSTRCRCRRVIETLIGPIHDGKAGVSFDLREQAVPAEEALVEVSRIGSDVGQYFGLECNHTAVRQAP